MYTNKEDKTKTLTVPEAVAALWAGEKVQPVASIDTDWEYYYQRINEQLYCIYPDCIEDRRTRTLAHLEDHKTWRIYTPPPPPAPPIEFCWHNDLEKFPVPERVPEGAGVLVITVAGSSLLFSSCEYINTHNSVSIWTFVPNYEKPKLEDES